ncbi:MAG: O-antigen ligase family protein [Anaerolineae bacterium]|nr:O-antigen ligase family protein [Anaerolineae bacterium]
MIGNMQDVFLNNRLQTWGVITIVLLGAAYLGSHPSILWLALLVVSIGALILLRWPIMGLLALIPAALVIPLEIGTGSEVALNPASLLVPALLALWVLGMVHRQEVRLAPSRTNRPLLLFLLAGLFSLLIGNALWDPAVSRPGRFIVVQLAQWAIFVFSAGVFWLMGNLVYKEIWLQRLIKLFLAIGGGLTLAIALSGGANLVKLGVTTIAVARASFLLLVAALAGGQLLFNWRLSKGWRLYLLAVLGAVLYYAFYLERQTVAYWVSVATVLGVLTWLRWPHLRWLAVIFLLVLTMTGILSSAVYDFAGGDEEWEESGGSRLTLIGRVVEATMRNPITGLGPAAYRRYVAMKPLAYGKAFWIAPQINSHNNYVDLFSHVGFLGLGLFFWFAIELTRLGLRLRIYFTHDFAAGYVNAMLAIWAGAMILMLFVDEILPFVYNIGFPGFQASVLVWLFLGGLVALENMMLRETFKEGSYAA